MMRMPARAEIAAAERRVVQSRLITRDRLRLVRVAYRTKLAQPSTLMLVVASAAVAGFCLTRSRRRATSSSSGVQIAATSSAAGVAGAFILQYAMRHLPFFVRQLWTVQQARAAQAGAGGVTAPAAAESTIHS